MKWFVLATLLLGFLTTNRPTYAQTYPCSNPGPGEVVVGQTEAGNGIAPMQLCQSIGSQFQSASPMHWKSRWGALAIDSSRGVLGTSAGKESQSEAELMAMMSCTSQGGTQCEKYYWYSNGCVAAAVGKSGSIIARSKPTMEESIQESLEACQENEMMGCVVYYKDCSLSVQS